MSTGSIESYLAALKAGIPITEPQLRHLCSVVKSLLVEECSVTAVSSPVNVCGDIHGQFYDLLELFTTGGEIPAKSYVFMGDFVDRGHNSVETLLLLLCLKALYPAHITLLRGNHESRQITQVRELAKREARSASPTSRAPLREPPRAMIDRKEFSS